MGHTEKLDFDCGCVFSSKEDGSFELKVCPKTGDDCDIDVSGFWDHDGLIEVIKRTLRGY